jgi:formiminotetrahydrofolate cyclodeaminase
MIDSCVCRDHLVTDGVTPSATAIAAAHVTLAVATVEVICAHLRHHPVAALCLADVERIQAETVQRRQELQDIAREAGARHTALTAARRMPQHDSAQSVQRAVAVERCLLECAALDFGLTTTCRQLLRSAREVFGCFKQREWVPQITAVAAGIHAAMITVDCVLSTYLQSITDPHVRGRFQRLAQSAHLCSRDAYQLMTESVVRSAG